MSFKTGIEPVVGSKHIQIVAIDGFPATSFPGILAALDTLPFEYRWNTRAILLDPEEAKKIITDALKKWTAKARGFIDQLMGKPPKRIDPFALKMMEDATVAIGEASSGDVQFCLYSGNIILMDEDSEAVKDRARQVAKIVKNLGFGARLETFNAVEAWRGTLPGDGYRNVRRIILHTLNLADCMPIAAIWTGDRVNSSALMPKNSEPLPKLASSVLQGSLQMGSSDLIAPAMSAAVTAGTIAAVAATGGAALAGGAAALGAGGAAAGGSAAGGAAGAGGSFMPGAAGGLMPGLGSTMAGGGGSGAAPGVEGAMNSVPPPAPSAGGGGGEAVAVDPPPISVAADSSPTPGQSAGGSSAGTSAGESATTGSSVTVQPQGKTTRVADAGEAIS
ncbi:MAG TPA: hypothetical protein VGF01_00455, partial [Terracidiphilus sp.]